MRFDTKIAVLLRHDLLSWQALNVTAFLASGVTGTADLLGEPYEDADGTRYARLLRQPVLVFAADADLLGVALQRALDRDLRCAIYTRDMFETGHDEANREVVRAVPRTALDLVGLAVHGPRNAVDKITKGASLHP